MRLYFLVAIIVVFSHVSYAQSFLFRNYSERDGLPTSSLTCVYQDSKGYIWFGTVNGLSRFDGLQFKNYKKEDGLPDNYLKTVFEDYTGAVWAGTLRGGACRFTSGKFQHFSLKEGLPDIHVRAIAQDKHRVTWFGTNKGLAGYDGKTFTTYTSPDGPLSGAITQILATRDGRIWFASHSGIGVKDNNRITCYTKKDGLVHDHANTLMQDSKQKIWIGTDGGLSCFHKGTFTSYTTGDGLAHNLVNTLMEDDQGNIWIGTWGGLTIFDSKRFFSITTENGLPDNFVRSIIQDREGNIWIASWGGASCLRSRDITTISEKNGLANNYIHDIIQDRKGRYWIGTGDGLNSFKKGEIKGKPKTYTTENGMISNIVNDLTEDTRGNIWLATPEGLSMLNPQTGKFVNYTKTNGLPSNIVYRMCPGEASINPNLIWIATDKGICQYHLRTNRFDALPFDSSKLDITDLLQDKAGNLWFSAYEGLYRYNENSTNPNPSNANSPPSKYIHFTTSDGLPDNFIDKIFLDSNGKLWIATASGLSCYTGRRFINYTTRDGLAGNTCKFVLQDHQGNIWAGTTDGLSRFDGKSFKNFTAKKHGLSANTWYSGLCDSKGTMWFGNAYGITRFHSIPGKPNPIPPPIYINHTEIPGKNRRDYDLTALKFNENSIRFDFTGICYTAPQAVSYKCRIHGLDSGWMETKNRSIFYPHLPPGQYAFQVKAINNDGIESTTPASIDFTILPPFWKTWWFYTLMALSAFLLITGGIWWRFKRSQEKLTLKARNRQLVLSQQMELMGVLAASAVHDLKNMLAIIIGYSEIVQEQYDENDENYQYNANIKSTADTAVQIVQQILSLARQEQQNQKAVNLSSVLNNLIDILKVTTPKEIKITWNPPPTDILYPINPTRFRQLVLNLCINAVHAMPNGGILSINLSKQNGHAVTLEITDTGTGIPPELIDRIFDPMFTTKNQNKGTGLGLFAVKQITNDHNGKIKIQSTPNKGTNIKICLRRPGGLF